MTAELPTTRENVPLSEFTTFRLGGPARYFVDVTSADELRAALLHAKKTSLDVLILGGGSNLLVADEGFDGLVIRIAISGIETKNAGDGAHTLVRAGAGELWDTLVAFAVERGLAGFECLSGIPGTVGATPIQNVGAYGQEVSDTIVSVEVLDRMTLESRTFSNADCRFAYRQSLFKRDEPGRYVVTAVTYELRNSGAPVLRYPDLQKYFAGRGIGAPSLAEVRQAVIEVRSRKGMVVREDDPDSRSAGSFFTNPILTREELDAFLERVKGKGLDSTKIPIFSAGDDYKVSAAWLIEHAGFTKGYGEGNVGISSKHTLALVNRGGGSAREVVALMREIQERVAESFALQLVPEPNFVGFD